MQHISKLYQRVIYGSFFIFVSVLVPAGKLFATHIEGHTEESTVEAIKLKNPLEGTVDSLPALVKSLLNIVLIIGTPVVALAIIYAGFMLVAAQGNAEKLTKARQALLWAIVGGAVLLGAYVLAQAIGGTVEQLTQ